jgi:hypothetical protein
MRQRDFDRRWADYRAIVEQVGAKARARELDSLSIPLDANSLRLPAELKGNSLLAKKPKNYADGDILNLLISTSFPLMPQVQTRRTEPSSRPRHPLTKE